MAISAAFRSRIDRQPRVILLTILLDGDPTDERHPGTQPRVIRAATSLATPVSSVTGQMYPYWPTLMNWPVIVREFSPHERRAPVSRIDVKLSRDAGFPLSTVLPATVPFVTARLDLWTPGLTLEEALPRLAGPISAGKPDWETGGVTITIEDGDTQSEVPFPPGQQTIDLGNFPQAPDLVVGRARRQIIFGPFPYPIPATQIDREGRRWYLCDPALSAPPTAFQVGGVPVTGIDRPTVAVGHMAADPTRTYTQLVFPQPIKQAGLIGAVTASGGVGYPTTSAAVTLLRDIGGYALTAHAKLELDRVGRDFDFSVFLNNSSNVLDIVEKRILPQTDLVMTQHLNQIEVFRLLGETQTQKIGMGEGFWNRVPMEEPLTSSLDVWNAIEVKYRRTVLPMVSTILSRNAYVVDKDYGGPIGHLLTQSQKRYGRRFLSLEAADLVEAGEDGLPLGVVRLAELTAQLTAMSHRRWAWDAIWSRGLDIEIGDRWLVTDPARGLTETPMRCVRTELQPAGPRVFMQTEDLP